MSYNFSGMDNLTPDNYKEFLSYPYPIQYNINSRGFRDSEWPNDFSDVIWCLGDSYTQGLGSPVEHRWSNILEKKTGKKCINLGVDGASNEYITLKALDTFNYCESPKIVVMWSFMWRRYKNGVHLQSDENQSYLHDSLNWLSCYTTLRKKINFISLFIPAVCLPASSILKDSKVIDKYTSAISKTKLFTQVDYGRDGFHFDWRTSDLYVNYIIENLDSTYS